MASFFGKVFDYLVGDSDSIDAKDTIVRNVKKNNFSSIAAKASEGILQFPVIVSNAIDFDTAILISKACERSYAGFAKVVFSMNRDVSDTSSDSVSDYLKVFHQNDGQSTTDSDPATLGNAFENFIVNGENETFECSLVYPKNNIMVAQLRDQLKPYIENFCLTKLNDLYQPTRISKTGYKVSMEGWIDEEKKQINARVVREADEVMSMTRGSSTGRVFGDAEVKKANEMQPTFILLKVSRISKESRRPIEYEITIGIKATLHVVPSAEYISNLVDACEYKGTLFRFIKWTTGEIDFIRDFVLRLDIFERETRNRENSSSGWWDALKKRARAAKISRVNANRLLPNATFVFTRAEVDYIKSNFGYDLLSTKIATQLMKEYFLLGYVVVDSSSEVVQIMYDGQKKFQTLTFRALERENDNKERAFKDMLRQVKKM